VEETLGVSTDVVAHLFPDKATLDAMLDVLPADPPVASLAVLHPLLPPASPLCPTGPPLAYDVRGYAPYARIITGLLQVLAEDRRAAKENVWALRHVLALALYAEDLLAVPSAVSPVFNAVDPTAFATLGERAQELATYLLMGSSDEGWRARVLTAVSDDKPLSDGGALPSLLVDLIGCARKTDGSRDCRILGIVLQQLLKDTDAAEAELWMMFSRKIERRCAFGVSV
jgi:hypothetical protein